MPALDGLRGVAVALVVTWHLHEHMWTSLSGSVGVVIFFVLSGYLITRLALQEERTTGQLSVAAFYLRRTFRILPLYYLVLAIYALLILRLQLFPGKIVPFREALPYYLVYFQEIPFWKSRLLPDAVLPFYYTWSLGVEEKFYLVWPILMLSIAAVRVNLRLAVLAICAALCVAQGIWSENRPGYHLENYGFILFGVSLALFLSQARYFNLFVRVATIALPVVIAVSLFTQFFLMPHTNLRGLTTVYALAVTVLLGTLVSSVSVASRFLSRSWIVLLGRISYGVYLVHVLCIGVVEHFARPGHGLIVGSLAYIGALLLSIAVAYILNLTFERPLISLGRRLSEMSKRSDEKKLDAQAAWQRANNVSR
jgi:peptidoglycan/LPS O-acetylase OafA/YrhL